MSEPIEKEAGPPASNDQPEVTEEKAPPRKREYKEFEGEEKEGAIREYQRLLSCPFLSLLFI
jgi:hypothetical protein